MDAPIKVRDPKFSLAEFMELSWKRGIDLYKMDKLPVPIRYHLLTAMTEELGEINGAIKKLDRGYNEREAAKMKKKLLDEKPDMIPYDSYIELRWKASKQVAIADESADFLIYFLLFCQNEGIDIWERLRQRFNEVSIEMGAPEYNIKLDYEK